VTPPHPQTEASHRQAMKESSNIGDLFSRTTPWLAWWQELILNWVATWNSVEILYVTSSTENDSVEWDFPSDTELKRMVLEELLDAFPGQR
jgi:hypothetical protein